MERARNSIANLNAIMGRVYGAASSYFAEEDKAIIRNGISRLNDIIMGNTALTLESIEETAENPEVREIIQMLLFQQKKAMGRLREQNEYPESKWSYMFIVLSLLVNDYPDLTNAFSNMDQATFMWHFNKETRMHARNTTLARPHKYSKGGRRKRRSTRKSTKKSSRKSSRRSTRKRY